MNGPKGSILGPLFLLIYANYLPNAINNSKVIIMYADDSHKEITIVPDLLEIQLLTERFHSVTIQ